MNWSGFNFYEKDNVKYTQYNKIFKRIIKPILVSDGQSTFNIYNYYDNKILSKSDAVCTIGIQKRNKPNNVNTRIEFINDLNLPNLIRDSTPLRSIIKITNETNFAYHSFLFNNIKPINDNFPYDSSYDRWAQLQKKYNLTIRNYHYPGEDILFILQLHNDQSLNNLYYENHDYLTFCKSLLNELLQISDRKVIVRSHPIYRENPKLDIITPALFKYFKNNKRILFSINRELDQDFKRSRCVISYNSNATVEALLFGLNVINLAPENPCMTAASNDLNDVENLKEINREEFFKKIAFLHWESEELTSIENRKYLSQLLNSKASIIRESFSKGN